MPKRWISSVSYTHLDVYKRQVFEQAAAAVINFNNSGLSILEIGHRTPAFIAVMEEARALVKELMQLDDDHEVLFLQGGASMQFMHCLLYTSRCV